MKELNQQPVFICNKCGNSLTNDFGTEVNGERYCSHCIETYFVTCSHCAGYVYQDDAISDDYTDYCQACYNTHYTRCSDCNRIIYRGDAHYPHSTNAPYCCECYDNNDDDYDDDDDNNGDFIHGYNYKPAPEFYGTGNRFFGVELEIDKGGTNSSKAEKLFDIANQHYEHIYIKTDGSLYNGLEIVTHPMSLEYHQLEMPWKELMDKALELGYYSHQTTTCGLHIHVSRSGFSSNHAHQEECISRVLYIVERFWEELLRFSRRTEEQLKKWASRYGYKSRPLDILDSAKNASNGRYTCVNLQNRDTIEFRIFRGTLHYNTLIATLQLVNEICDMAVLLSDEEVAQLGWPDFAERIDAEKYPELVTYLKERRLYINDAVATDHGEEC